MPILELQRACFRHHPEDPWNTNVADTTRGMTVLDEPSLSPINLPATRRGRLANGTVGACVLARCVFETMREERVFVGGSAGSKKVLIEQRSQDL